MTENIAKRLKTASKNTLKSLAMIAPMILAVIGLVGLFEIFITPEMIHSLFHDAVIHDTLIGTLAGAVSVGQPFLSYIIGGELLKEGVSFYAVTAFILSYVTLGVIQLPLEFSIFGMRFAVIRNLLSILFAILISWTTVYTIHLIERIFA
ncbi:permease [Sulfurimonas paralvinellae]|uniref:Permease n=1 Tax=Sulfurimonas paralvinellae TaxID=317658 RepID=A0A7M1B849_9BACT|nr:permease [Sulfurimonas paralvinellae]QOP45791.1 permease [Sulfurimonas paralvinellae]